MITQICKCGYCMCCYSGTDNKTTKLDRAAVTVTKTIMTTRTGGGAANGVALSRHKCLGDGGYIAPSAATVPAGGIRSHRSCVGHQWGQDPQLEGGLSPNIAIFCCSGRVRSTCRADDSHNRAGNNSISIKRQYGTSSGLQKKIFTTGTEQLQVYRVPLHIKWPCTASAPTDSHALHSRSCIPKRDAGF